MIISHHLDAEWQKLLADELSQPHSVTLNDFLTSAYQSTTVFPPEEQIFNAFNLCPPHKVKVVIIGQDPYHAAGQAHGLCFSVNENVKQPPSLKNIFKELEADIPGFKAPASGNLKGWSKQGVLLLNAILTVKEATPGSHKNIGWEQFTDAVIRRLSDWGDHIVFMLWGNYAMTKSSLIDHQKHLVLTAAHPSPLARGAFFGCRHFSKANEYLLNNGLQPVNWSVTSDL